MVGAGMLMILLALLVLFMVLRKRLEQTRWLLWILPFTIALPYLANTTGWLMTEMGRQPWIVFGLLKTASAVSPTVGATQTLITLVIFTLVYGALAVADVYLLQKYAREEGDQKIDMEEVEIAPAIGY